jgi:hypothetical protein
VRTARALTALALAAASPKRKMRKALLDKADIAAILEKRFDAERVDELLRLSPEGRAVVKEIREERARRSEQEE